MISKNRLSGLVSGAVALVLVIAASACNVPGDVGTVYLPTQPNATRKLVSYGPFTIPAAQVKTDGTHGEGMLENNFKFHVEKPCEDCYLTGVQASLKHEDGRVANYNTDAMLHHMVLSTSNKVDPICSGSILGFLGERWFASGNERTPIVAPAGFGYDVGAADDWTLIYDLMNMKTAPQTVSIEMTYDFVPKSTPGMKPLKPVWLDIEQCGLSEKPAQTGKYAYDYTWTSNIAGRIIGTGGHLHDAGTVLSMHNATTGEHICNSRAKYGETPGYIGHHGDPHLSTMSICYFNSASPIGKVKVGDNLKISAQYDTTAHPPHGDHPVMGIQLVYIDPSDM